MNAPTLNQARFYIILASLLWSIGGICTRLLQRETVLGLHEPSLTPLQIAFYRSLFAGLFFLPMIRFRHITFRPLMPWMVASFASMNALFLSALALGSAANAILLQNLAPFWVYLLSVYLLGEPSDRRTVWALLIAMLGIGVILGGGWYREGFGRYEITLMAIGSSLAYSFVILCLRKMRTESSQWLTMQNHLGSGICLASAVLVIHGMTFWLDWITRPSWQQLIFLALFGSLQMALPYLLFAYGLRVISPQEAGMITLIEPLLNPLWAYFISPETDTPPLSTLIGGSCILLALAWRYMPKSSDRKQTEEKS